MEPESGWMSWSMRAVYVCFVIIFSVLATMYTQPFGVAVEQFSTDLLSGGIYGGSTNLAGVQSIDSFWDFMETTFYSSLYHNQVQGTETGDASFPTVDDTNSTRLIGEVVVYTIRVKEDVRCGVTIPFSDVFGHCWADKINGDSMDEQTYGSAAQYDFSHALDDMSPVLGFNGEHAYSLSKGGFVGFLSTKAETALASIEALRNGEFIEADNNRLILLLLTLFHPNLKIYSSVRVQFEIGPSGQWRNFVHSESVSVAMGNPLDSGANPTFLALYVVLGVLLVMLVVGEFISFFVAGSKLKSLKQNWLIYLVLLLVASLIVYIAAAPTFPPASTTFLNSSLFFTARTAIQGIAAVAAVLVFAELVCWWDLQFFHSSLLLLLLSMVLFAISFRLTQTTPNLFSSMGNSLYFVSLSLVGVSDWAEMDEIGNFFTYLFLLLSRFVFFPFVIARLVQRVGGMLADRGAVSRQLGDLLSFSREEIEKSFRFYVYEKWDLETRLKFHCPGIYYRYVVTEQAFRAKVDLLAVQRVEMRKHRQNPMAEISEELSPSNLSAIQIAAEDVKDKISAVELAMAAEVRAVTAKLGELERVFLGVGRGVYDDLATSSGPSVIR